MLEPLLSRAALMLSGSLLIVVAACSTQQKTVKSVVAEGTNDSTPTAVVVPKSEETVKTKLTPIPPPASEPSVFELALDKANGGFSISQSARSPEDWNLVGEYYFEAIDLMKQVKQNSQYFGLAQAKILEYQRQVKFARQQALSREKPPPKPRTQVAVVPYEPPVKPKPRISKVPIQIPVQQTIPEQILEPPQALPVDSPPSPRQQAVVIQVPPQQIRTKVFVSPIKRRMGGTPIIEATFNGDRSFEMIVDTGASGTVITKNMADILGIKQVGTATANTANAKAVEFAIGYVKSIEVGGAKENQIAVAIAGSELETGLLGHDFFGNYDITIKQDVVEFRPRSEPEQPKTRPAIQIYPPPSSN